MALVHFKYHLPLPLYFYSHLSNVHIFQKLDLLSLILPTHQAISAPGNLVNFRLLLMERVFNKLALLLDARLAVDSILP